MPGKTHATETIVNEVSHYNCRLFSTGENKPVFKIEQPAELNRFVDRSIPLTWAYRWEQLRIVLPILIFCVVLLGGQGLLVIWSEDAWERLPVVAIAMVGLIPFFMIMIEFLIRIRHWSKRILVLREKKIVFGDKRAWHQWNVVRAFRLEPIANQRELRKLSIEYQYPKAKSAREWSLVIDRPESAKTVLEELNRLKSAAVGNFEIEVLTEARPFHTPGVKSPIMWFFGLAFLLFTLGMPLTFVGLTLGMKTERGSNSSSRISEKGAEKMARFLYKHFDSLEEMRRFFLLSGSALLLAAVGCVRIDNRRAKRFRERLEAASGLEEHHVREEHEHFAPDRKYY
jgi:hypothetical protein